MSGRRGRLVRVIFVLMAISCLASSAFTWTYWGYPWVRPDVPKLLSESKTVHGLALVGFLAKSTPREVASVARKDPADSPVGRGLVTIDERGLLQETMPAISLATMAAVEAAVLQSNAWERGVGLYAASSVELRGTLIDFESAEGKRYFYAGLGSGQISNDHFAFAEQIYEFDAATQTVGKRLSEQRFYYDVAGIEFVESWLLAAVIFVVLALVCIPLTFLLK